MKTGQNAATRTSPGLTVAAVLFAWLAAPVSHAQTISLDTYLDLIRTRHPFFVQEALSIDIALKRQERFLGDTDWEASIRPSYTHNDTADIGFGTVNQFDNTRVAAGIGREVWATGGRLDLLYDYDHREQDFNSARIEIPGLGDVDLSGPTRFYRNAVSATYSQPLLQNRGGDLSRLRYDLQGLTAEQTDLAVQESQEDFLLQQGLLFMNWVRQNEELAIARERLRLAEEELVSTQRKLDAHIVEEVDLYRAKDAMLEAKRNVRFVESRWKARQAELAVQAQDDALLGLAPHFDLYALAELPDADAAVRALREHSRIIRQLGKRKEQLTREKRGLTDAEQAELELVLSAGLKDGETDLDRAVDFDQPDATIALAYRYPLGNTTARADLQRNVLELAQVDKQIDDAALGLESQARSLITQLTELADVLAINREQVRTAADKTRAEEHLYEQGRNELNFVIQSRDQEALARQLYALNAVDFHSLWLQLKALLDDLLPEPSNEASL